MLTKEGKIGIVIAIVWTLGAYGFGRWSAPDHVKIETKIVEVEKKTTDTDTNRDKHKKTTVVETTKPDGTKEKTTVITEDTDTERKTHSTDDIAKTSDTVKELSRASKVTLSALAGMNVTSAGLPVYGVSVSKPILGPITVGAFGFQNGLVGASLGLTF